MIKKLLIVFLTLCICFALVACGSNASASKTKGTENNQSAKTNCNLDLDKEMKGMASKADFTQISNHQEKLKGEVYFVRGEVNFIKGSDTEIPMFTIKTKESNLSGKYDIVNFKKVKVKKGDKIKVYGKLTGKNSKMGNPEISGNTIEKLN